MGSWDKADAPVLCHVLSVYDLPGTRFIICVSFSRVPDTQNRVNDPPQAKALANGNGSLHSGQVVCLPAEEREGMIPPPINKTTGCVLSKNIRCVWTSLQCQL